MTRLRLGMIEDMQIGNLSPRTQTTYISRSSVRPPFANRRASRAGRHPNFAAPSDRGQAPPGSSISVAVAALRLPLHGQPPAAWTVEDASHLPAPPELPDVLVRLKPAAIDSRRMVIRVEKAADRNWG